MVNRQAKISRRLILRGALVGAMGLILLDCPNANGFWQYLLRYLVRGAFRSRTFRNIRLAQRTLSAFKDTWSYGDGYYIRKVAALPLERLGIDLGHIVRVSKDLRDLCFETKPDAIWVEGKQNTFQLDVVNHSSDRVRGKFVLTVNSIFSDRQGIYEYGDINLDGKDVGRVRYEAPAELSGRVVTLGGYIEGVENVSVKRSGNIVLARKNEVDMG